MLVGHETKSKKNDKNNNMMAGDNLKINFKMVRQYAPPAPPPYIENVFMYYGYWNSYAPKNYTVLDIEMANITHLFYAFAIPNPTQDDYDTLAQYGSTGDMQYDSGIAEGTLVQLDQDRWTANKPDIDTLIAANPNLKVLISICGASHSWHMHNITASSDARDAFAISAITFCIDNGWHGIDIDWEYCGAQSSYKSWYVEDTDSGDVQPANMQLFLARIRLEMDNRQPSLILTAVSGAQPLALTAYDGCNQYLDYFGIMNYDYSGISWGGDYGHHCNTSPNPNYSAESNELSAEESLINVLATTDIALNKIHMGFPCYARGWWVDSIDQVAVELSTKSASQPELLIGTDYSVSGMASYRELKQLLDNQTLLLYHDNVGKCDYAYDNANPAIWSLPNPEDFANFYITSGCRGIVVWEAVDNALGDASLVTRFLNQVASPYTIIYPVYPPSVQDDVNSEINVAPLWENKWNNPGTYRKKDTYLGQGGDADPYDATTTIEGGGYFEIENGICILGGGSSSPPVRSAFPRFYSTVDSVNCQAYIEYMRVGTNGAPGQGCIIGLRSNLSGHGAGNSSSNPAHTYYFKYTHAGNLQFDFEPVHTPISPENTGGILTQISFPAIIPGVWHSMKFECYNKNGETKLKGYIDGVLRLEYEHYHSLMYDNLIGPHTAMIRNGSSWNEYEEFQAKYRNYTLKTITLV